MKSAGMPSAAEDKVLRGLKAKAAGLAKTRLEIVEKFRQGKLDSVAAAKALALSFDRFLRAVLRPPTTTNFALLAVGSYGRCETTARSDLDCFLVYDSREPSDAIEEISHAAMTLWDSGIQARIGVYSIEKLKSLAKKEQKVMAAFLDYRLVLGNETIRHHLEDMLSNFSDKDIRRLARFIRCEHSSKAGTRYYDLYSAEPDIKVGQGGLRDLAAIGWFQRLARGVGSMDPAKKSVLHRPDIRALFFEVSRRKSVLCKARSTLLRARLLLDLAQAPRDRLTRDAYVAIGRLPFGPSDPHAFSRELSTARRQVFSILSAILEAVCATRPIQPYRPCDQPERLFFQCTKSSARRRLVILPPLTTTATPKPSSQAYRHFLRTLSRPNAGAVLSVLHRWGTLDWLIPAFERTIGFVCGDEVHAFTLDRHLVLVAAHACDIVRGRSRTMPGVESALATGKSNQVPLLLAALLHDLGKAQDTLSTFTGRSSHTAFVAPMARAALLKMGISREQADVVVFLCERHMLLPQASVTMDTESPSVLNQLCEAFPKVHLLDLALILGLADMRALGPEVSTAFREGLLVRTWSAARCALLGRNGADSWHTQAQTRRNLLVSLARKHASATLIALAEAVPDRLAMAFETEVLLDYLVRCENVFRTGPALILKSNESPQDRGARCIEAVYLGFDEVGLLSRLSGSFTLHGFSIQEARIFTIEPKDLPAVVIDVFSVRDPGGLLEDYNKRPIETQLLSGMADPSMPARVWARVKEGLRGRAQEVVAEVDNASLPDRTVIRVVAPDCEGLLFAICDVLYRNGIDLTGAVVTTEAGVARDTFFAQVARLKGKVTDPEVIRRVLREVHHVGKQGRRRV